MRNFPDCKHCKWKHRHSKCLPCETGENFEPDDVKELDFNDIPKEFWPDDED